jgi:hypothetical protein
MLAPWAFSPTRSLPRAWHSRKVSPFFCSQGYHTKGNPSKPGASVLTGSKIASQKPDLVKYWLMKRSVWGGSLRLELPNRPGSVLPQPLSHGTLALGCRQHDPRREHDWSGVRVLDRTLRRCWRQRPVRPCRPPCLAMAAGTGKRCSVSRCGNIATRCSRLRSSVGSGRQK